MVKKVKKYVISSWNIKGFSFGMGATDEVYSKYAEVQVICYRYNLPLPNLVQGIIDNWGVNYEIVAPLEVLPYYTPVWRPIVEPEIKGGINAH